jgi:hypothetical protein
MYIGVGMLIFNYNFDYIAGRCPSTYNWGWVQWVGFGVAWLFILWGWIVRRAYKDWDKDIEEEDLNGKGS